MASEPRGCLASILGIFGGSSAGATAPAATKTVTFPYTRSESFLSPSESSFFAALRIAVADEYEIFPKVRLLDVLRVKPGAGWQSAFNKVQSKHLDFLLCERGTFRAVLALELDDSSHQQSARKARDAFVEEVLEVVGLPALRCPVTRTYDPREIARLIKATLSDSPSLKN